MTSQYLGVRCSHSPGGAWVVAVWNTKVDQSGTLHWVHGLEMSWNAMKCLRSSCCSVALWCFAKKNREMVKTLTVVRAWKLHLAKECERGFRPFAPDCQAACFITARWCLSFSILPPDPSCRLVVPRSPWKRVTKVSCKAVNKNFGSPLEICGFESWLSFSFADSTLDCDMYSVESICI